jgi:hypothetical protein
MMFVILGRSFEEHLHHLQEVFDRLRTAGLKLHPDKCALCQKQVMFLGHISEDGVATNPSKTRQVVSWPVPMTPREVRQFLGLASYYRRFIKDFATIVKSPHRLTEKNTQFKWTPDCQTAFETLHRMLVSAPILAFPDYTRPFLLNTDTSDNGVGAVLSQVQEDEREHVIAYASRVFTKAERRYCVTRRELLAVVAFLKQFRPYFLGRYFTLRSDHGSLTWLRNFREPEGQLARWLKKLEEYDSTVQHRPGRKHDNADALSWMPHCQCGRESHSNPQNVSPIQAISGAPHSKDNHPEKCRNP